MLESPKPDEKEVLIEGNGKQTRFVLFDARYTRYSIVSIRPANKDTSKHLFNIGMGYNTFSMEFETAPNNNLMFYYRVS